MILSYHPLIFADKNMLCAGRDPDKHDLEVIQQASAVILPIGCKNKLYRLARENCRHVFPNYDMRFDFPGKLGQIKLFLKTGTKIPQTFIYSHLSEFEKHSSHLKDKLPLDIPFIFKFDWGGEGENVFLVRTGSEFSNLLDLAQCYEKTGQKGFLLQEMVPDIFKSLRVVVVGQRLIPYWRIQENRQQFKTGISSGASIDYASDSNLIDQALSDLRPFLKKTDINLAGFDFLFSPTSPEPYFIEINYFFGRRGLGGSGKFNEILLKEINQWLEALGLCRRLELDTD